MRLCLARLSATFLCAAWLLGALPASAKPAESQDNSLSTELGRLASTLTTHSERAVEAAGDAAARALHDGQGVFAEAQSDIAKSFEKFSHALNEQKAELGMIAEDATARLKKWQQETIGAWLDTWPDNTWSNTWAETMSEIHSSATEALNRLHEWLKKQTASEEPAQISI